MAYVKAEWDTLADDTLEELGHVTVVITQPDTRGTLAPDTKLRTGATELTTPSIQAARGALVSVPTGPVAGGAAENFVQRGRWVVKTDDVAVAGTPPTPFTLRKDATLTETDGHGESRTFTISSVTPEMGGRQLAIEAQRTAAR